MTSRIPPALPPKPQTPLSKSAGVGATTTQLRVGSADGKQQQSHPSAATHPSSTTPTKTTSPAAAAAAVATTTSKTTPTVVKVTSRLSTGAEEKPAAPFSTATEPTPQPPSTEKTTPPLPPSTTTTTTGEKEKKKEKKEKKEKKASEGEGETTAHKHKHSRHHSKSNSTSASPVPPTSDHKHKKSGGGDGSDDDAAAEVSEEGKKKHRHHHSREKSASSPTNDIIITTITTPTTEPAAEKQQQEQQPPAPVVEKTQEEIDAEYRLNIVKEIIDTEEVYVEDLKVIVNVVIPAMKAEPSAVPPALVPQLFTNVEVLLGFNSMLLTSFKSTQGGLEHAMIGKAFLDMAQFLKMYTIYAVSEPKAEDLLRDLSHKTSFNVWLVKLHKMPEMGNRRLHHLLMKPIQRLCKYPLLLRELIKKTKPDHPDYANIDEAARRIQDAVTSVNESKRVDEINTKVVSIQHSLEGPDDVVMIISPTRRYVREGQFQELLPGGKTEDTVYFLFNDLLLRCKPPNNSGRLMVKSRIPKELLLVSQVDHRTDKTRILPLNMVRDHCWLFDVSHVGVGKFTVIATSETDRKEWVEDMQKIMAKSLEEDKKKQPLELDRDAIFKIGQMFQPDDVDQSNPSSSTPPSSSTSPTSLMFTPSSSSASGTPVSMVAAEESNSRRLSSGRDSRPVAQPAARQTAAARFRTVSAFSPKFGSLSPPPKSPSFKLQSPASSSATSTTVWESKKKPMPAVPPPKCSSVIRCRHLDVRFVAFPQTTKANEKTLDAATSMIKHKFGLEGSMSFTLSYCHSEADKIYKPMNTESEFSRAMAEGIWEVKINPVLSMPTSTNKPK